jgi:ornithine carbamoyltransferase
MHFLNLSDFNSQQLTEIFTLSENNLAENNPADKQPLLGKTIVLFFPDSSIRTRISFEKAVHDLGGQAILFPPTSLDKPEALQDVMGYIRNWASMIIVRHNNDERIQKMAAHSLVPVINAMSSYCHPCEILSDLFAIKRQRPDFAELRYTFVGAKGNILQSWVNAAKAFDFQLKHVAPISEKLAIQDSHYQFSEQLDEQLPQTDVLLTDSLPLHLKNDQYYSRYQITKRRIDMLPADALFNPCPPFFRGEEVSSEAISSDRFVGYEFKESLLTVQKAIIEYCLTR